MAQKKKRISSAGTEGEAGKQEKPREGVTPRDCSCRGKTPKTQKRQKASGKREGAVKSSAKRSALVRPSRGRDGERDRIIRDVRGVPQSVHLRLYIALPKSETKRE